MPITLKGSFEILRPIVVLGAAGYLLGSYLAGVVSNGQSTKVAQTQMEVINQAAYFTSDIYDLREDTNPKDTFNLSDSPALPTLATVMVFIDGKIKAEGSNMDYVYNPPIGTAKANIKTTVQYSGVIVQIRYLAKQR